MPISPIGASNPNQLLDPTTFQTQMQQAMSPVAQLFNESSDQLMSELDTGKTSLSALAAQKGVPRPTCSTRSSRACSRPPRATGRRCPPRS